MCHAVCASRRDKKSKLIAHTTIHPPRRRNDRGELATQLASGYFFQTESPLPKEIFPRADVRRRHLRTLQATFVIGIISKKILNSRASDE